MTTGDDSRADDVAPSIFRLDQWCFDKIAQYLEPRDIINLRCTCDTLRRTVRTPRMTRAHFIYEISCARISVRAMRDIIVSRPGFADVLHKIIMPMSCGLRPLSLEDLGTVAEHVTSWSDSLIREYIDRAIAEHMSPAAINVLSRIDRDALRAYIGFDAQHVGEFWARIDARLQDRDSFIVNSMSALAQQVLFACGVDFVAQPLFVVGPERGILNGINLRVLVCNHIAAIASAYGYHNISDARIEASIPVRYLRFNCMKHAIVGDPLLHYRDDGFLKLLKPVMRCVALGTINDNHIRDMIERIDHIEKHYPHYWKIMRNFSHIFALYATDLPVQIFAHIISKIFMDCPINNLTMIIVTINSAPFMTFDKLTEITQHISRESERIGSNFARRIGARFGRDDVRPLETAFRASFYDRHIDCEKHKIAQLRVIAWRIIRAIRNGARDVPDILHAVFDNYSDDDFRARFADIIDLYTMTIMHRARYFAIANIDVRELLQNCAKYCEQHAIACDDLSRAHILHLDRELLAQRYAGKYIMIPGMIGD